MIVYVLAQSYGRSDPRVFRLLEDAKAVFPDGIWEALGTGSDWSFDGEGNWEIVAVTIE